MGALMRASTPVLVPACSLVMPITFSHIELPCSAVLQAGREAGEQQWRGKASAGGSELRHNCSSSA